MGRAEDIYKLFADQFYGRNMDAIELPGGWKVIPAQDHNPCYLMTPEGLRCQVMETHTAEALVRMAKWLHAMQVSEL